MSDDNNVVKGRRRRPGDDSTPQERPSADAPRRRDETQGTPQSTYEPSTGGTSYTPSQSAGGGGGNLLGTLLSALLGGKGTRSGGNGKISPLLIIGLLLLVGCCCVIIGYFALSGSDLLSGLLQPTEEQVIDYPTSIAQQSPSTTPIPQFIPTSTPLTSRPTTAVSTSVPAVPTLAQAGATSAPAIGSKQTWLVLLYQDADDQVLEKDIFFDLNEAEKVGSTAQVKVVAQMDRYVGAFSGDGNWTSARRYYVTKDADLTTIHSQMVADLGEVNMADGKTLVDFVTWAIKAYPADKVALILSDHGSGWPGGWSDATARSGTVSNLPLSAAMGDQLFLMEIDQALGEIRSKSGLEKFELIGMDACLMGHLEVLSALAPHARYFVGSQEVEPALGWAYASFLQTLNANPGMNGGELGKAIVSSYITSDQRIVDDTSRAEMAGRGTSLMDILMGASSSAAPSAAQISTELSRDITLTAVDLGQVPALMNSVNNLANTLQQADPRIVAMARDYAQKFTSIFGTSVPPSYMDLGNFAGLLVQDGSNRAASDASNAVLTEIKKAVIAEKHGSKKSGATGISIYFPNSQLYRSPEAGPQSYTVAARRFAEESLWDDFLVYYYTGKNFKTTENQVALPSRTDAIRVVASGGIEVGALQLSATEVSIGKTITMRVDLKGDNLGYVKLLVGYWDQQANSIYLADSDYIEGPRTKQFNGVYYPDWGKTKFTLEFDWDPIVFAINDGKLNAEAVFMPEDYGASAADASYSVDGIYTFSGNVEKHYARLSFRNGSLWQVLGFNGQTATGAAHTITPQAGDTFTILEKWMDLDAKGQVTQVATQNGKTVTFGSQNLKWKELNAAAGKYVIGFLIEDLDGNQTTVFKQVTVK